MTDLRHSSPPTWPAPPEDWVPPQGSQPDPAWGPAPEGWEFWVPAQEAAAPDGGRPNRDAWRRTALLALISVVVLAVFPIVGGADDLAQVIGSLVGRALVAYLVTATWAFLSRRRWSWLRHVLTFVGITLLLAVVSAAGAA